MNSNPSPQDILSRLRALDRVSAVSLSRVRLPASMSGGYNKGCRVQHASRGGNPRQPHSMDRMCLSFTRLAVSMIWVWNLRARFVHPPKMPMAIPLTDNVGHDIQSMAQMQEAQHFFGLAHNLARTSFSVSADVLREISAKSGTRCRHRCSRCCARSP